MAPASTYNNVEAFHKVLRSSRRILALCGAGLSASSGLPTFRGAGGYWRHHDATKLATMEAFEMDPGLVWLFYGYRRHMALNAKPNAAHYALAELAKRNNNFLCLTQNVDNLSPRAGHRPQQLQTLHGNLFDVKCTKCDWIQRDNYDDPFCPALAEASKDAPPGEMLALLDPYHRLDHVPKEEIPVCPSCKEGLQRPGVVWFGEMLDNAMLVATDSWISSDTIDIMFVIGTSAQVWPAAGYIDKARAQGASVVVINPEAEEAEALAGMTEKDFAFGQDAATYLPLLLEPIIGTLDADGKPTS